MDEKEKSIDSQENVPENKENDVKVEENDNWEFEANAPTLEDNLNLGNDYEIKIDDVKGTAVPTKQPAADIKSDNIVIKKKPIKIALAVIVSIAIIAVLIFLGVRYYTVPNSDERMNPGNIALTVGDTDVSVGMYNYYYTNITYSYLNSSDIDTSADFATQYTVDEDGNQISWLEKFKQDTINQIKVNTVYYEEAVKAGVTLSDDQKETIDQQIESIEQSASDSGMSVNEYISSNYGDYCGVATLRKFFEQIYVASNYYFGPFQMEMKPSQDEIDSYFNENSDNYKSCTYALIEIPYDATDDNTVAESITNAQKYCDQITDIDSMRSVIPEACAEFIDQFISYGYFENAEQAAEELGQSLEITNSKAEVEQTYDTATADWMFSDETPVGSTTYCINEEYGYISLFLKTAQPSFNETEVYSVRHILIMPESADAAQDDTATTEITEYTDEEWAAALTEAENILALYNKGDKTEKSFALLAEEYSDDTESTSSGSSNLYGGAFEGTELGVMVSEFEGWATDDSRQYGDVDIVKSKFGYHIMYFMYDGPKYLFNVQSDLTLKNSEDYIDSYKVKEHSAIKKAKVAKPLSDSSTQAQSSY